MKKFITLLALAATIPVLNAKPLEKATSDGISLSSMTKIRPISAQADTKSESRIPLERPSNISNQFIVSGEGVAPRLNRVRTVQVPHRAATTLPVAAAMISSDAWSYLDNSQKGYYEMPTSGQPIFDPLFYNSNLNGVCVVVGDKVYSLRHVTTIFSDYTTLSVYDLTTGERVSNESISDNCIPKALTYDKKTDSVYGSFVDNDSNPYFGSFDLENNSQKAIKTYDSLDYLFVAMTATTDGAIYGINADGKLYKIDATTGEPTLVGETGAVGTYLSTATYDERTGFIYYPTSKESGSALYKINPNTAATEKIYDLVDNEQFTGMYMPAPKAGDKAPSAVEQLALDFAFESLTGTINFTLPKDLFDGTPYTGDLSYTIKVGDDVVASGNATAGDKISKEITLPSAGNYTFYVYASNSEGDGPQSKISQYIGYDTPTMVTNLTLTYADGVANLSWDASAGANGMGINADEVTYTITRATDGAVLTSDLKATSYADVYTPENDKLELLYYTVTASYHGVASPEATTDKLSIGYAQLPYESTFATSDEFRHFTVIDNNGDNYSWYWTQYDVRYYFSSGKEADDYLVLPPMRLEKDKIYTLQFDAYNTSSSSPERIAAYVGTDKTVEALTTTVVQPTDLVWAEIETLSGTFIPQADGVYYFAVKACSTTEGFMLRMNRVSVSAGTSTAVPQAVTDLQVTPGAYGELSATLSFTAPSLDYVGKPLTSLEKVEIMRGDELIATINPAIGAATTYVDNEAPAGDVTYTVVGYSAEGRGFEASATAYIGLDVPSAPMSFKTAMGNDYGELLFTWDAVTTDCRGNALHPESVTYTLALRNSDDSATVVAEGITDTSYRYRACEADANQTHVRYYLYAVNATGTSDGAVGDIVPVGAPYKMPYEESFANGDLTHAVVLAGTPTALTGTNNSYDNDNGFFAFYSNYKTQATLWSARIDLTGDAAPEFSIMYYCVSDEDQNALQLVIDDGSGSRNLDDEIIIGEGVAGQWNRLSCSLADYAGKVVTVGIKMAFVNNAYIYLDGWRVGAPRQINLAAGALSASTTEATVGDDITLTLNVCNYGATTASGYSVDFFSNEKKIATVTGADIAAGANASVEATLPTTPLTDNNLQLYAVVNIAGDEFVADNTSSTVSVTVAQPKHPTPTALQAEMSTQGVALSWQAPSLGQQPDAEILESFEEFEPYSFTASNDWIFVDVDQASTGGLSSTTIPNFTVGDKATFFVMSNDLNSSISSNTGNQFLAALFAQNYVQNDDWAISPVLPGIEQTVTYYARPLLSAYPETIELYYSTGSTDTADFTLLKSETLSVNAWQQYEFTLPTGAKRFAVRYCSTDQFMVMLDDFSFIAVGKNYSDYTLVGYNVYRDGVKINESTVTDNSYVDTAVNSGTHSYNVTALYATHGESSPSNTATIDISGVEAVAAATSSVSVADATIIVTANPTESVLISDIAGRVIYNGIGSCRVKVGHAAVYLVKVGTDVYRLAVK
jgi:hypothetical protein